MQEQTSASAAPRKRVGREVVGSRRVSPITASLFEEYAREYLAGVEQRPFLEFAASRLNVTRASAERMLVGCYVETRVRYQALKVGLVGAMDEAERAGRQIWEDVA